MNKSKQDARMTKNEADFIQSMSTRNIQEFQVEIDDYQLDRFRKLSGVKKRGFFRSPLLSFWVSSAAYPSIKVGDKIHVDNDSFEVAAVILFKDHELFLANSRQYLDAAQLPLAQSLVVRKNAASEAGEAITIIRATSNKLTVFKLARKWAFRTFLAIVCIFLLAILYMQLGLPAKYRFRFF